MKIKGKKRIFFLTLITVLIIFAYKKVFSDKNISNMTIPQTVYELKKGNIELNYEIDGNVVSEKEVLIYSNLVAKVKKVNFRKGDVVKKGDVLAVLDPSSLDDINSNIEKLRITYETKQKELSNAKEVYKVGGLSKNEITRLENEVKFAKIDLDNSIRNSKDYTTTIISTVSGVITESYVDENLKVDQSKYLFKIVDIENLKIYAEVPNNKVKNLKVGNDVIITSNSLEEGKILNFKIDEIAKISKKDTTFNDSITDIMINITNDTGLKPNDSVKLNINYFNVEDVLLVNFLDVIFENGKSFVYTLDKDNIVRKNEVVLGITNNIVYEVKSGLNVGDRILNNTLNLYKEGDKLK